jgi:hypothetical protein
MSAVDELYAEIEKAKPLLQRNPDGSRTGRIGGLNVYAKRTRGKTTWRLSNKGAEIWGSTRGRSLRVEQSEAWRPGKGHGSKLYRAVIGRGRQVASDAQVSPSAQRRYRGLARQGAKVYYGGKRAPPSGRSANGDAYARRNGRAVFVVNPKTKPKGYRRVFKAGLIRPGKRPLLHRIGFLLSTGKSDRKAAIGRYLEGRKAGLGFGPKGKRRRRTGNYTGVYATGVNKSEHDMSDPVTDLYDVIEKAAGRGLMPRGSSGAQRRLGMLARRGAAKPLRGASPRSLSRADRAYRASNYLQDRTRGGFRSKLRGGKGSYQRKGVYKAAADDLYDVIEKAGFQGGTRGALHRMTRGYMRNTKAVTRRSGSGISVGSRAKLGRKKLVRRLDRASDYLYARMDRNDRKKK